MALRHLSSAVLCYALHSTAGETGSCSAEQQLLGSCRADHSSGVPVLVKDHQLLQVQTNKSFLDTDQEADRDRRVPGEFSCKGMPDVKRECSENGCKVLADRMWGKSCDEYCARDGRTCVAAWEEVSNDCQVRFDLRCDQSWGKTSDLLCQCSKLSRVQDSGAPRSDPSTLQMVWSDEFGGNHVDTAKWSFVTGGGGFGNQELQYYTDRSSNARVKNGILTITAKCEEYGRQHFTSAKLRTKHKGAWAPGHRVDVRARAPTGRGSWPAIWMLPEREHYGSWPKSGEIDIMEAVGCTNGKVFGTVHTEAYNHVKHTEKSNKFSTDVGGWHVYSIEWTESEIRWYIDDHLYHRFAPHSQSPDKWPYKHHFYLILNVAVGGSWGGFCLHHKEPSCHSWKEFGREQTMQVDYARIYKI